MWQMLLVSIVPGIRSEIEQKVTWSECYINSEVAPFHPPISSYLAAAVLLPGAAGCVLVGQRDSEAPTLVLE